ncbi:hypothetical protein ACIQU2_27480 [Pseudomonas sp. NPDC098740]|uniref:hypothetical protein n=1 Tax=Pseudomonas sp. NPDC098740 TaxID=3364486 RepID=UPI00383A7D4D
MRELSRALPAYAYGDPAKIVEAQQIRAGGCAFCERSETVFGVQVCLSGLKFPACRRDTKKGHKLTVRAGG